jgi:hypothetical protein
MRNNLVDVDAHRFKNHVVHRHGNSVNDHLFNLNVEHGDEQLDQHLDMCVLLREQQRPPLQEGERDVDQVDGGRDRVGDNPPLVHRQNLKTILLGVVNQLAPVLLVECEQAPKVDLMVGLLWAFHVHADDEDIMRVQIDRECVGELDLAAAIDALDRSLDNNVDLMWRTTDPQNLVFGTHDNVGHDTGVLACHGVFTVS